jgi:hypothetical protein
VREELVLGLTGIPGHGWEPHSMDGKETWIQGLLNPEAE